MTTMFCINVVLRVQNPEEVEAIAELLTEAGRLSRKEPGCLRFEVCQDDNDPRNILLIERWESKQAWETHKEAEAFTSIYQPKVLPYVDRTPYFCRILE